MHGTIAVPASRETASDLHNQGSELATYDDQVREMLAWRLLRTYRATRHLVYEIEDIRAFAFQALTEDSLTRRVDRAIQAGSIDTAYLTALQESTALVHEPLHAATNRFGEVSIVSSRQPLAYPGRSGSCRTEKERFGSSARCGRTPRSRASVRLGHPSLIIAGIES